MRSRSLFSALLSLQLVLAPWRPAPVHAAPSGDDARMVALVAARVFAEAEPVEGWAWPPRVAISDNEEVNAFATICEIQPGDTPEVEDAGKLVWLTLPEFTPAEGDDALSGADAAPNASAGDAEETGVVRRPDADDQSDDDAESPEGAVTQPVIVINQGFLDAVVKGNPDRLAAVFGHETAHILLRHVDNALPGAPLVANMINRQQESDADVLGMKLGLAADFPYKGLVAGILGMREQGNYNSFEGLNASHPGWTDRVAMIDERQRELWQSISAFENGVYFLMTEQYELARKCFQQVTEECPKCYEAWANLGYAYLMLYCDKLEVDDLRDLEIGQLVVGGFYRRPESLETQDRGFDDELWWGAVGALRQAIILNPDLVLAKANLAVAYLVAPEGKDVKKAEELFAQVTEALKNGDVADDIDPLVRATLLVNAGVAEYEAGDQASAEALFAQAQELFANADAPAEGDTLVSAIHYNRGRMYAAAANDAAQRRSAIDELESYLTSSSSAANWWPLAYEQYVKLCKDAGVEPKGEDELSNQAHRSFRLVTGLTLPDGTVVTLNDTLEALEASLGKGREQEVVKKSNIHRRQYHALGLEVLCTDRIAAFRLRGGKAPALVLRSSGLSGETIEIRPGMTLPELEALLGGDAEDWDQRYGTNTQIVYRFYTRLGFGVRLAGDKITEIIVAQIPVDAQPS